LGVAAFHSRRTKRLKALFDALPEHVQRQVRANYQLFKKNPRHPSLQFKQIGKRDPSIYSARAGIHHRAIGFLEGDTVTWFWIGSHEDYDKLRPHL
jgi:hypothetical protein